MTLPTMATCRRVSLRLAFLPRAPAAPIERITAISLRSWLIGEFVTHHPEA
jgi:hypothetical protein